MEYTDCKSPSDEPEVYPDDFSRQFGGFSSTNSVAPSSANLSHGVDSDVGDDPSALGLTVHEFGGVPMLVYGNADTGHASDLSEDQSSDDELEFVNPLNQNAETNLSDPTLLLLKENVFYTVLTFDASHEQELRRVRSVLAIIRERGLMATNLMDLESRIPNASFTEHDGNDVLESPIGEDTNAKLRTSMDHLRHQILQQEEEIKFRLESLIKATDMRKDAHRAALEAEEQFKAYVHTSANGQPESLQHELQHGFEGQISRQRRIHISTDYAVIKDPESYQIMQYWFRPGLEAELSLD